MVDRGAARAKTRLPWARTARSGRFRAQEAARRGKDALGRCAAVGLPKQVEVARPLGLVSAK